MWLSGNFAGAVGYSIDKEPGGKPKIKPKLPPKQPPVTVSQIDVEAACALWRDRAAGDQHARLAASLGVSSAAVATMGAGIVSKQELDGFGTKSYGMCWTHPMRNVVGQAVGVRLCPCDGSGKFQLRGTDSGMFLREDWCRWLTWEMQRRMVWIVEGRSDPMALLTLDPDAAVIGRPNNAMMPREIAWHCKHVGYSHAVIIPDNDAENQAAQKQTQDGARALRDQLKSVGLKTAIVVPGKHADLRSYVQAGGTVGNLRMAVTAAEWSGGATVSDRVWLDRPWPFAETHATAADSR